VGRKSKIGLRTKDKKKKRMKKENPPKNTNALHFSSLSHFFCLRSLIFSFFLKNFADSLLCFTKEKKLCRRKYQYPYYLKRQDKK
jgi:hypothetical protein